jgi:hypothetical protein
VNVHFLIVHQTAPEINDTTLFRAKLNLASEKVRPKKGYFSSAWEYVKLDFSLRVSQKIFLYGVFCVGVSLINFFYDGKNNRGLCEIETL